MDEAEIKTIISANTASFEAGLAQAVSALKKAEGKFAASNKKTENAFQNLGKAAKGLASAFLIREAVQFGQKLVDVGDKLQTLSERTGVSASFFSALQPEIENAGGSLDDFAASLNKMNVNIAKAASGDTSAEGAFKAIGLSAKELAGLKPEEQFYKISTAIAGLSTKGQQAAAAVGIFGKGVSSILPTLSKGGDALRAYHDEQVRLGLALDDDTARQLDDLGDSIHTLSLQVLNFSAKALIDGLSAIKIGLIGIAENGILAGKALGLIDAEVAAQAIAIGEERVKLMGKPQQGPNLPGTGGGNLTDPTAGEKAASNAEKLTEALSKLQRQTSRDIYTSGLTPLEAKLKEVDFTVEDLARQYKTKLTPEMERYGDTAKANIEKLDGIERVGKLAEDMGSAFSDAFEQGILGAESFGDVLSSLANQLQKIFFQQAVTQPLTDAFKGALSGLGGGGIFDGIGKSLTGIFGSFATGTRNVPHDMTARLHKGETVMTRQETESMQKNGSKSQGTGNTYQIDARGADQGAVMRIEKALIALAGPGVIERRVVNAQTRGAL